MKLCVLMFLILSIQPAFAQEKFKIGGAGALSCGKFLEQTDNSFAEDLHIQWAQGFLSGLNAGAQLAGADMVLLPDAESIWAYLINYCRQNPLQTPFTGNLALYRELQDKELQERNRASATGERP